MDVFCPRISVEARSRRSWRHSMCDRGRWSFDVVDQSVPLIKRLPGTRTIRMAARWVSGAGNELSGALLPSARVLEFICGRDDLPGGGIRHGEPRSTRGNNLLRLHKRTQSVGGIWLGRGRTHTLPRPKRRDRRIRCVALEHRRGARARRTKRPLDSFACSATRNHHSENPLRTHRFGSGWVRIIEPTQIGPHPPGLVDLIGLNQVIEIGEKPSRSGIPASSQSNRSTIRWPPQIVLSSQDF